MANVKITDLAAYTDPDTTDVLPIVDVGADVTKKIAIGEVVGKITGDVNVATNGTSSIASGAIVNGDINASAAISDTKLDTISTAGKVSNSATTATSANTASAIVARDASGDFSAGTITADLIGNADTATALSSTRTFEVTGDITGTVTSDLTSGASIATSIASGVIVDADVNASAAIAGTKIDPDFGSQTVETTGDLAINTNTLFVDSSEGKVGVGNMSPAAALHISNSVAEIRLTDSDGAGAYSQFISGATGNLFIGADPGNTGVNSYTAFLIDNSEKARIDSSGRLLVGTSSTSQIARAVFQGNSASNPGQVFFTTETNAPSNGATLAKLIFADSGHVSAAEIDVQRDGGTWTSGSSQPTSLAFSVTADGSASPTEALRITNDRYVRLASGSLGIQFNGGTAAANALDDYEEGTFTPTIIGMTTAGAGTYSIQIGRYTKIGRVVNFFAYMVWSAHTGTGLARVDGLPFASVATTNLASAVTVWNQNWTLTANNIMQAYQIPATTQIIIQQYPVGGGTVSSATLDTSASLMVAGHYIV